MKKNTFILIVVFFTFLLSCSKDDSGNDEQGIVVIKIKEHKTNLPLEGVNLTLYGCGKVDWELGCVGHTQANFISDANGNCNVPRNVYTGNNEKAKITKPKYWNIVHKYNLTELAIEPEAKVFITLRTTTEYPSTSYIELKTTGELGLTSTTRMVPAQSSTFNFRLFGNEENKIDWILYDSGYPGYPNTNCRTCMAIAYGSFTLHPQKFENLTYTLNY